LKLLRSAAFVRRARRLVRKNPATGPALRAAIDLLTEDPLHARLRTHKLKGRLARRQGYPPEGRWPISSK